MGAAAIKIEDRRYSKAEFLELYPKLEGKYKLHHGKIVDWYMLAGTSEPHALINLNLGGEIRQALHGKTCRAYGSDLLVRIASKASYRHPDLTIVCGPTEFDKVDNGCRMAVMNPKVIFEIMSDSSEKDDCGEKFAEYRESESMKEYIFGFTGPAARRSFLQTRRRHVRHSENRRRIRCDAYSPVGRRGRKDV